MTLVAQVTALAQAVAADVKALYADLAGKQSDITPGTTTQYWRGDKTWQDLPAAVRAALLTGLSTASSADVAATDTVLAAIGKLQATASRLQLEKVARSGFVGTVSQLAGVPTGAIIERGSNANGSYVRYADGTQTCTYTLGAIVVAANGSSAGLLWAYPAAFSAAPGVFPAASLDFSSQIEPVLAIADRGALHTATGTRLVLRNLFTSERSIGCSVIAHGRWF